MQDICQGAMQKHEPHGISGNRSARPKGQARKSTVHVHTCRVPGCELVGYMLVISIGFGICAGAVAAVSVIHIPCAFTAEPGVPGTVGRSAAWHSAAGSAAE